MELSLNNKNLGDKLLLQGASSASINDILGTLTKVRRYVLTDNKGENSFLSNDGFLSNNSWRGRTITEKNDNGVLVFDGVLDNPELIIDRGFRIRLNAKEPLSIFLNWPVETNAIFEQDGSNTWSLFNVNGNHNAGYNELSVNYTGSNTPVQIPVGAVLTFSETLTPRYMVTSVSGSSITNAITLDRPLENDVANNTKIRISVPASITPSAELKRVLTAVGLGPRLGATFDLFSYNDSLNNILLWLNIFIEDGIKLGEHISKILELGNFVLYESSTGVLDIRRLLQFDGNEPAQTISEDEFITPIKIWPSKDKLVVGYDCLYRDSTAVEIASNDVDDYFVNEFAGVDRFQPIALNNNNLASYKYLFDNSTAADFIGQNYIEYHKTPRLKMQCRIKSNYSNAPLQPIEVGLAKNFGVTLAIAPNRFFVNEPAAVVEYNFDEKSKRFQSITFEFTNYYAPAIPRLLDYNLSLPVIDNIQYNNKTVFCFFAGNSGKDDFYIQVFLSDKKTKIVDAQMTSFLNIAFMSNNVFNFADNYYCRFYRKKYKLKSNYSDWYRINTEYVGSNEYGNAIYGISQYE